MESLKMQQTTLNYAKYSLNTEHNDHYLEPVWLCGCGCVLFKTQSQPFG
jgi:hypothetical protein